MYHLATVQFGAHRRSHKQTTVRWQ